MSAWWQWIPSFDKRQRELAAARQHYGKSDFVKHFTADSDIASEAWDRLMSEATVPGFRPFPSDNLLFVFGLAEEDLEDVLLDLLQAFGFRVPSPEETAAMEPIESVEDLVRFIAKFR